MESLKHGSAWGAARRGLGRWRQAAGRGRVEEASADDLLTEISTLTAANRSEPDAAREKALAVKRHRAGAKLVRAEHPRSAVDPVPVEPDAESGLVELTRDGLSAAAVRGLVDPDVAKGLADGIERSFAARVASREGGDADPGYYDEFRPEPPYGPLTQRKWIEEGGAVAVADSPSMLFRTLDEYERAGILPLVADYLGEPVTLSAQKCALRRTDPQEPGGWHQDGSFMGRVHALNVWLSLSDCGETAPGLDFIPRRLDGVIPTGGEGTTFPNQIAPSAVDEAAAQTGVIRPRFAPGDAVLFDDIFLHRTGSNADMPDSRYAIECWFFGASGFPEPYVPLAA
jgi:hypothetical protein